MTLYIKKLYGRLTDIKLNCTSMSDAKRLHRIVSAMTVFFDGVSDGVRSRSAFNKKLKKIFLRGPALFRLYRERVYILKDFFIPLELLLPDEAMILFNALSTHEVKFLHIQDDPLKSTTVKMALSKKIRRRLLKIAKRFYFDVIIKHIITTRCKQLGYGRLFEWFLTEELTLRLAPKRYGNLLKHWKTLNPLRPINS